MRPLVPVLSLLWTGGLFFLPQQAGKVDFDTPRKIQNVSPITNLSTLRIVTWNIDRGGSELDTIASELEHNPADLYLLQEVDLHTKRGVEKDVGEDLAKRLNTNLIYGIEFEELSQEHGGPPAYIGQATLTRLPLKAARVLRFKTQSGFWKPRSWIPSGIPLMQRRLGSRIALVTELKFAGRLLVVYNVHLESRSAGPIQAAQVDEIFADLKRYPADTPIVVAGDVNSKYFPSIFLHKFEREGFHSATGEQIERTHAIVMTLDWIFAKGPVKIEEGQVRRDLKGSDHYPEYAELMLQ